MPLVYVIAGENSGDVLGASYVRSLKKIYGNNLRFRGVGGEEMREEGVDILFDAKQLSYFGIAEVVRHFVTIIRLRARILADIRSHRPDFLLTIDLPDFNFSIGKWAKKNGIPVVHVGAPTVWAWRAQRAHKVAQFLDGLACLFPFEPPYFTKYGLNAEFLGHPSVAKKQCDPESLVRNYGLMGKMCICLLPGSRASEIERLGPLLCDVALRLAADDSRVHFLLPIAAGHHDQVRKNFVRCGDRITFVPPHKRYEAMTASVCALAASGTVTLELAMCQTPMVVLYKVHALTALFARWLVYAPYAALPNIISGHSIVQEFIQNQCTATRVYEEARKLMDDASYRSEMKKNLSQVRERLSISDELHARRLRKICDFFMLKKKAE
ncbi:MAG: lipid-A-disaccharide synthase [Alphaproteobacteria bacterium]|nr:MAG: lipid-A-disaccharide synthase [Alphaproteobacteria bacterium]